MLVSFLFSFLRRLYCIIIIFILLIIIANVIKFTFVFFSSFFVFSTIRWITQPVEFVLFSNFWSLSRKRSSSSRMIFHWIFNDLRLTCRKKYNYLKYFSWITREMIFLHTYLLRNSPWNRRWIFINLRNILYWCHKNLLECESQTFVYLPHAHVYIHI